MENIKPHTNNHCSIQTRLQNLWERGQSKRPQGGDPLGQIKFDRDILPCTDFSFYLLI